MTFSNVLNKWLEMRIPKQEKKMHGIFLRFFFWPHWIHANLLIMNSWLLSQYDNSNPFKSISKNKIESKSDIDLVTCARVLCIIAHCLKKQQHWMIDVFFSPVAYCFAIVYRSLKMLYTRALACVSVYCWYIHVHLIQHIWACERASVWNAFIILNVFPSYKIFQCVSFILRFSILFVQFVL